jgi:hypothetical protein
MDYKNNNIIHIVIAILALYFCYVIFIRIFSNDIEGFTDDKKDGKNTSSKSSQNSGANGIASNSDTY